VIYYKLKPSKVYTGEAHVRGGEISIREVRKRGSSERLSKKKEQKPLLGGGLFKPLVYRLKLLSYLARLKRHFHLFRIPSLQ